MKTTTIQIHEDIKKELDKLKDSKDSYEETIMKLIEQSDSKKKDIEKLMIEGYKAMAKESLKITKEFEAADREVDEKYGN